MAGNEKEPINLALIDGEISLWCDGGYSDGRTSIPAKISKNTPDAGFLYDVAALMKLFQAVGGKIKLEIDAQGYMLVKTLSEVYLQLPMRSKIKKEKPAKQAEGQNSSQSEQKGKKKVQSAEGAEDVKEVA